MGTSAKMPKNTPHSFSDVCESISDAWIEGVVQSNERRIVFDSRAGRASTRIFQQQIRLHLPGVNRLQVSHGEAYDAVRDVALVQAQNLTAHVAGIRERATRNVDLRECVLSREGMVETRAGRFPITVREVKPSVGSYYQRHLHFLQAERDDTCYHFGTFIGNATMPVLYIAISRADRSYLHDLLRTLTKGRWEDALILTRVVGVTRSPRNLVSYTVARIARLLRRQGFRQPLVTAMNPNLGFSGASLAASGFVPFATADVLFCYERDGSFTTRRLASSEAHCSRHGHANILTIRRQPDINRILRRERPRLQHADKELSLMTSTLYPTSIDSARVRALAHESRSFLERGWNRRTVHPQYSDQYAQASPLGQCGVSSAWLGYRIRDRLGISASYCYGDLFVDKPGGQSVPHHCWLEIAHGSATIIVDVTADQAGIAEKVIVEDILALESRGLRYRPNSRRPLDHLQRDDVWSRYNHLRDVLNEPSRRGSTIIAGC